MSYVRITKKEFEYALSHLGKMGYTWKKLNEQKTLEDVYMVSINGVHIKIFSSVVDGVSRNVGSDAVRVVGWDVESDRPIMSSEMRLTRTKNWSDNLKLRIQKVVSKIIDAPSCKICGGMVVEMKGKFGKFMGCLNYKNHAKFKEEKSLNYVNNHGKFKRKFAEKDIEFWK